MNDIWQNHRGSIIAVGAAILVLLSTLFVVP